MTAAAIEPPALDPDTAIALTVPYGALTAALTTVGIAINSRPPVPILGGVLLTSGPAGTYLTGFDYRNAIRVRVGPPSTEGRALVGFHGLNRIVRSLGRGSSPSKMRDLPVTITTGRDSYRVDADGYEFTLPVMPAADHPLTGTDLFTARTKADHWVTLDRDLIATAVKQANRCAGRDDTLPMLTGINLEATREAVTLAATDRFRLGVAQVPGTSDTEWAALIPAAQFARVAARLPAGPVDVEDVTAAGKRYAVVAAGPVTAAFQVIDTEFVEYRRLLPEACDVRFLIDRVALIALCERLAVIRGMYGHVLFTITEDGLRAEAGGRDEGRGVSPLIRVIHSGTATDMTIGFNPAYLIEGLRSFTGPAVAVGMNTPARPAILADQVDQLGDTAAPFRYLVMPARIPTFRGDPA